MQKSPTDVLTALRADLSERGVKFDVLDASSSTPGEAQSHIDNALRTLQKQHASQFGADYPFIQSAEAGITYVNDPRVALLRATQEVYNAQDALANPMRQHHATVNLAAAKAHITIQDELVRADGAPRFATWEDHTQTLSTLRERAAVALTPAVEQDMDYGR